MFHVRKLKMAKDFIRDNQAQLRDVGGKRTF